MVVLHLEDGHRIEAGVLEGGGRRSAWNIYCPHVDNENGEYWEVEWMPHSTMPRAEEILCKYCAQRRGIIW